MARATRVVFPFLSVIAVTISVATFYITELRRAEISVLISETAYLGRDANGSAEVVLVPITIVNTGAREGVVRTLALTVERLDEAAGATAQRAYFAAHVGVSPGRGNTPFAPIVALRETALSEPILFYPTRPGTPIIDASGVYRLTLSYDVETGAGPLGALQRLWEADAPEVETSESFEVRLPYYSVPELVDGGMIRMSPTRWAEESEE